MTDVLVAATLAAGIAGLVTNLLVPATVRIARAARAMDRPGGRKLQPEAVPRLGGLALVTGLAMGAGGVAMVHWGEWGVAIGRSELVALALGTLMIFLVGVVDDILGVSAVKKLLVQAAAAYLLVHIGWSFNVLSLPGMEPLELGIAGRIAALVWIVGVTNAINLLDGLDGLASGVVAIIASGLLVYSMLLGNLLAVILMAAIMGACLGFLRHNWAPAKIFLGDSGSLTLGFLLAATSVHSSLKAPAAVAILVPILVLGLPVIDTLAVMAVRFLAQPHSPPTERFLGMFHADRNHLHHVLERFFAHRTRIVALIYGAAVAFCAMAVVVAVTHNVFLGLLLVLVQVAAVLLMRSMGMLTANRRASRLLQAEAAGADDREADRTGAAKRSI